MNKKLSYRNLCAAERSIPIFSQDWWLDSVAGPENWDVALVEKQGEVAASMPYVVKRRFGLTFLRMPTLTQTLGPWIRESNSKYGVRLARQKELMQQLIDQLPPFDHFLQNWHHSKTNWLPFYWNGFKQTTRYTYIISDLTNLDQVFKALDSSYRNKIRKAEKVVSVRRDLDLDEFYRLNSMTFSRQMLSTPYTLEYLRQHDLVLASRNQRQVFYAIDGQEAVHSALYLTWDGLSSYVHMAGEDPALRSSGAGILLIWEAIKYTRDVLKLNTLDFEGSMLEGVERVRRDCGAKQVAYFCISKTRSRVLRARSFLAEMLRGN